MAQCKSTLLDIKVPVAAVFFPYSHDSASGGNNHLFISLEGRFEAEVVCELCIFEFLEDEGEVQNEKEVRLHVETIKKELEVSLEDL